MKLALLLILLQGYDLRATQPGYLIYDLQIRNRTSKAVWVTIYDGGGSDCPVSWDSWLFMVAVPGHATTKWNPPYGRDKIVNGRIISPRYPLLKLKYKPGFCIAESQKGPWKHRMRGITVRIK